MSNNFSDYIKNSNTVTTHLADGAKHREIADGSTGVTDLWSANKIMTLSGTLSVHLHDSRYIRVDSDTDVNAHTEWQDNKEARFGNDGDLQIFHNGTNSFIDNLVTGSIYMRSSANIYIRPKSGENGIDCIADGAVNLYYDNVKKFETTNTGVSITGDLTTTDLRTGIEEHGHLPGMTQGVGEDTERINVNKALEELLIKVEEYGLYILELGGRIEVLETVK